MIHRRQHTHTPALVMLCALVSLSAHDAIAAPQCLSNDNPCEPNKLCTFKAALAEKALIYQIYLSNSQKTKAAEKRDGVRYDGTLYEEAMTEAQSRFPDDSLEEQKEKAARIFQDKVKEKAARDFRRPVCRLGGSVDLSLLPKEGYEGMFTNAGCQIRVNFEGGDYDAATFGANDATSCAEFYDRDRAHEVIHQRRCKAAKERGNTQRESIDGLIEEEVAAYKHSVKLTKAYVKLLAYQCSTQKDPPGLRSRARQIDALLTPYQQRGG